MNGLGIVETRIWILEDRLIKAMCKGLWQGIEKFEEQVSGYLHEEFHVKRFQVNAITLSLLILLLHAV